MAAKRYWFATIVALAAAFSWRQFTAKPEPFLTPFVQGRNNTVLFAVNEANGLSNVHLAATQALLEHHPDVEIHFASFPSLHKRIPRVEHRHSTKDNNFHALSGRTYVEALTSVIDVLDDEGTHAAVAPAGLPGVSKFLSLFEAAYDPWTLDEHYSNYKQIVEIINRVDPAVVVLDWSFQPGIEAAHHTNRQHAFVLPNHAADIAAGHQPRGAFLWKYPAVSSGYSFPVPWHLIPANAVICVRLIYALLSAPTLAAKRAALKAKGIQDPLDLLTWPRSDVPVILSETPHVSIPLDYEPQNIVTAGPIVLSLAAERDAELTSWIQQKPTVLINLGSAYKVPAWQIDYFITAIDDLMARSDGDLQILWKLKPFKPIKFDKDRWGPDVRVVEWLQVDPASLLETGSIVAFVNHGGAGAYNDGLATGTPQVVLPMWVDCYNFARRVHDVGHGVYACQEEAPYFTPSCISQGIWEVAVGPRRNEYLMKAKEIKAEIKKMGHGRDIAANEIARLARFGSVISS